MRWNPPMRSCIARICGWTPNQTGVTIMRVFSNHDRPVHMSRFPLERLPRTNVVRAVSASMPPTDLRAASNDSVAHVMQMYFDTFAGCFSGPFAPQIAPVPDDPTLRSNNLKAFSYFLDAAIAGTCRINPTAWL